ncbi:N-acetylneuraminate synthase family protein [Pigmentiphaga sp. H8]|uniref:N-acetylneuraminate synthase family protein n=1 Tax=Pigmentiphaga sp. H8 TaxID=2488560 RepID=UPI00192E0D50|nr:N-acetylneuraminate synthase family protein [Pigmentiphaga sp. H8]
MNSEPMIKLGGRQVGANQPTYIIAEIGVNHNGSVDLAHRLIDAAKEVGADAVKFQTFRTEDLILQGTGKAAYQTETTGAGSQYEMLKGLELPFEAFKELKEHCITVDIDFMSTAFDPLSLDFVASLSPTCLKWPSGEITNLPLLRQAAKTKLPVLLSTGMGSIREIATAVEQLPNNDIVILQCVSNYPARLEDQNLRVLPALQAAFGCPVGFSDHTIGPYAALAARSLGMSVLEKHFTLDQGLPGPDHRASIEPKDFRHMVDILRQLELGLGDGIKRAVVDEQQIKSVARKSLVYRHDLAPGHILTEEDLCAKRPGTGVSPDKIDLIVGLPLTKAVRSNTLLELADVR